MPTPTFALTFVCWVLVLTWHGSNLLASASDFEVYIRPGETYCSSEYLDVPRKTSSIGCASLCLQRQCRAYFYEGGMCSLTGLLAEPSIGQKSADFRRTRFSMSSQNIALNKPTDSSGFISLLGIGATPGMAVDGDDSIASYFQSSLLTVNPWWYVDLGETHLVKEVQVMFDGDGSHTNLFNLIEIRVGSQSVTNGDFSDWKLLRFFFMEDMTRLSLNREYQTFSADTALCGRYISIKKIGLIPNLYFSLNEVKVFALEAVTRD